MRICRWNLICPACYFYPYAAGGYTKLYKRTKKMTETLANGYSFKSTQRELSNEYQHDRVWMFIKDLCILVHWMNIAVTNTPGLPLAVCSAYPAPCDVWKTLGFTGSSARLSRFYFSLDSLIRISGFHMIFTPLARQDLCVWLVWAAFHAAGLTYTNYVVSGRGGIGVGCKSCASTPGSELRAPRVILAIKNPSEQMWIKHVIFIRVC